MHSKIFDMSAHEAKLDRLIAATFSSSSMSNAKWRKAFLALSSPELGLVQLVWKFVGRSETLRGGVPDESCLGDLYIRDVGFSGFPYKEIEWVEVPRLAIFRGYESIPFKRKPQDAALAREVLNLLGQFDLETVSEGLRLYGYRRTT